MRMDYGLNLELTQKLVMTPELRQAIAILQLSSIELSEMIEEQLMENPILEVEEKRTDSEENIEQSDRETDEAINEAFEWADYFQEDREKKIVTEDLKGPHENIGLAGITLHEHLEFQLQFASLDQVCLNIGRYLVGCIDDNGYLTCPVEEAARLLGFSTEKVEEVLKLLQTFDPLGVGARSLQECLTLQLQARSDAPPWVLEIVEHYLPDVASCKFKAIADELKTTPHAVQIAVDYIRTLDPKPGRAFGQVRDLGYIIPDVTIEKVNGKFVVLVNDSNVPRLSINPYYRNVVREADQNAKKFIESRLSSAVWLIKSIEQRRRTLYNVVEKIIEYQYDFFEYGLKHVKPLTMKKVADSVGVHESTVSRAIANKYALTPHGVVPLKQFFTTSVHSVMGEDVAVNQVKDELKALIGSEDASHPYSDQKLSELLEQKGFSLSRRTVTKYREEMGLASSTKRKRY